MKSYQDAHSLSLVLNQNEIQDLLLGRMKTAALSLVTALFEQDVERLCGTKFSHKSEILCKRGGSEQTSVVVAGARHPVKRPRVRQDGKEVVLPSYSSLGGSDILDERMMAHMIEGVSTRAYDRVIEDYADRFGTSKSSVSRAFKRSSIKDLESINGQKLSSEPYFALMIDGIEFAKRTIVVALGVTVTGRKHILGLRDGATENAEVCTDLLESIVERGFSPACESLLCVLDGAKALKAAVKRVFGARAAIQRCYLHKQRNITRYLSKEYHPELSRRIKTMMKMNSYEDGFVELTRLQEWIDTINAEAAGSLREVGEDLLTVHRLGVVGPLRQSLSSTNLIESIFSTVRTRCSRVKNWKQSPDARLRWVASAVKAQEPRMRSVRGVAKIPLLIDALNRLELKAKVG